MISNTIVFNESWSPIYGYGGGINNNSPGIGYTGANNIIWGNTAAVGNDDYCGELALIYTDCSQDMPGEGNINADPMFVNPANWDFHLQEGSPCIDAGDPNSPLDPDSTIADMGALYYDQSVQVIEPDIADIPSGCSLSVFPNPFNARTVTSFKLQVSSYVNLTVYDIAGREVARLVDGMQNAGQHQVVFDAKDLTSGVYFARLTAGDFRQTRKMLLVK